LTTSVHEAEKLSLDQIEAFLNASEEIRFEGENREQVYGWVEQVLRQQQYPKQGRKTRGRLLPRFWGRGLVSEAGVAVLKMAFQTLRMPEVVAFAAAGNVRSIRVMERLGLKCDPHKYFDHPAVTTSICGDTSCIGHHRNPLLPSDGQTGSYRGIRRRATHRLLNSDQGKVPPEVVPKSHSGKLAARGSRFRSYDEQTTKPEGIAPHGTRHLSRSETSITPASVHACIATMP
jgi:hypothetical protein